MYMQLHGYGYWTSVGLRKNVRMKKRVGVKKGLSVGFVNTPLGREMGMRYSNDQRMTAEQKEAFLEGGSKFLHEKAEELSK